MALLIENNAYSRVAASLAIGATTLIVDTGTGDRFPIAGSGNYFKLTLQDAANNIEIIKVNARAASSDSLTIERAQEGTTARAWNIGDIVELRLTAGVVAPLQVLEEADTAALIRGKIDVPTRTGGDATGTWGISITGNAGTATALQTARLIGGVSFNGTANIDLPGVNVAGNQSTSGNAATATALAGASFVQANGLSNGYGVTNGALTGAYNALMGVGGNATWLLSGTSGGVFRYGLQGLDAGNALRIYSGTSFIEITGNNISQGSLSGNAGTATALQTSRLINGVSFNGTANIDVNLNNSIAFNNGGAGVASGGTFNGGSAVTVSYNTVGAPSTTGTGASGTWAISITGNAATVGGASIATTAVPNTVVQRDPAGYIFGNYINMLDDGNPGAAAGASVTSFITKTGDDYYRSVSPSAAMVSIRSVASGDWPINVTGNAATATNQSGGSVSATTISGSSINVSGTSTLNGRRVSDAVGADTVVTRDPSGHSFVNYINSNTANAENPAISQILTTNGDNFYRKSSLAHVGNQLNAAGYQHVAATGGSGAYYGARAFVNFQADTGTPSIRYSQNVSSITDEGVGQFTINMTTAQVDANYSVMGGAGTSNDQTQLAYVTLFNNGSNADRVAPTTSAFRISTQNGAVGLFDPFDVCLGVFR